MKKFFTVFFVTLGVIFFILILIGTYFFITDPLNLKPIFLGIDSAELSVESGSTDVVDKNPVLSPAQEQALESIGVDPASVPSEITPAQEACFESVLGKARVDEIKAGDTPSATEFFKARECIE